MAVLLVGTAATSLSAELAAPSATSGRLRVYFGTYTHKQSKGIYVADLDLATGRLDNLRLAAAMANPSFLALHPQRPLLYAVGEMGSAKGLKGGAVAAFAIDRASGQLTLLNQQSSQGSGPCHVSLDRTGRCALVANYNGGSVACLPIQDDGRLGEAASFIQHQGSSTDRRRQQGPHAHSIQVDAANRFAFAPDLGADKIFIYRLEPASARLTVNDPPSVSLAPGSGPRHFAFHPNGRFAYVVNEMASTLTVFAYDAQRGALETRQTISTLPAGFSGASTCAEVEVHPSGKFLYASNRGHDSIAAFTVDADSGKLCFIAHEPTQGKNPRSFATDPTGRYLLAANQDGDNVLVLAVDPASGKLQATGVSLRVSMPVCVMFAVGP
jgi:6-phosphogluconolactonase